jgi:hypothetical protein
MNQPPDDDFYNSSTDNTQLAPQQQPGQAPGYPQWPQAAPDNHLALRGSANPPDVEQLDFPQADPANQPGFGAPKPARAVGQPGPAPQSFAARELIDQGSPNQSRSPSFPPPTGPISQPGFSAANRSPEDLYATQPAPRTVNNPPSGSPPPPWQQQQPGAFARQPQPNPAPWQQQQPGAPVRQQPDPAPWQQPQPNPAPWQQQQPGTSVSQPQQSGSIADWPTQAQPQPPAGAKKPRLLLIIGLIVLTLLVIGGGTFELVAHKNSSPTVTPITHNTSTANRGTPTTRPTASRSAFNSVGVPVQAGNDWLVTITSARATSASLIAPNAGNTYLEMHLTLKNISARTITLASLLEFSLTDASGHRYNETVTDTNLRRTPDGNINAHQTLDAQIAYEVPKNQHTFIFTFAFGLSSGSGASVSWKLTA